MPTAKSLVSKSATACNKVLLAAFLVAAPTAGCSQKTETPQQHLTKANAAIENDHLVEAEKEYREVLRLAPTDAVALRQLGILYLDQGQLRQALPLLKR